MFRANQCLYVVSKGSITEQKSKSRHLPDIVKIIAFARDAHIRKGFSEVSYFRSDAAASPKSYSLSRIEYSFTARLPIKQTIVYNCIEGCGYLSAPSLSIFIIC